MGPRAISPQRVWWYHLLSRVTGTMTPLRYWSVVTLNLACPRFSHSPIRLNREETVEVGSQDIEVQ
jgi:hypothetical protein